MSSRSYKSKHLAGPGAEIASVSGSTGDYDITLDSGEVITGYDETAGSFSTAAPLANDLCIFGILTGIHASDAANAEVIPAALAAVIF